MKKSILFFLILFLNNFLINAQNIVIKAGHFFDSQKGKMYKNQVIVIRNRKIIEVGSAPKINDKDKIIDLSNSWVLPGLMDCHVHVTVNLPYRNVKVE